MARKPVSLRGDISRRRFGEEPVPVPEPQSPAEREALVNRMAGRIAQTYLQASPREHHAGETFYSHDAHGTARAIAAGYDPASGEGRSLRATGGMPVDYRRDYGNYLSEPQIAGREDFARQSQAYRERNPGHPGVRLSAGRTAEMARRQADPGFAGRLHRAAGTLAALSPQTAWEENVAQAHEAHRMPETAPKALARLRSGERDPGRPADPRTGQHPRYEVRDAAGNKMALNRQPTQSILNAVDIAHGSRPPEAVVASDPAHRVKIGSFQQGIEHPHDTGSVTVDYRAHDIATGRLRSTKADRGLSQSPRTAGRTSEGRRYDLFEEAHNRAADLINSRYADRRVQAAPVTGRQVQGVTWHADRNAQELGLGRSRGAFRTGQNAPTRRADIGKPTGQM